MKMALRFVTSATMALSFAAMAAFGQASVSRLTGTVSDASGTAVARAMVILSTAEGRTEAFTTSSAAGAYVFTGLQPGGYILQVFAVGFGPSRMTNVHLEDGKDLKQDLTMDIGYVRENMLPASPAPSMLPPAANVPTSIPGNPPRLRLNEELSSRNLIVKPEPVYPELARQARIQGIVIIEIVIGNEGVPKDIRVISGHPLLQRAAIETVKDYRYRPQFINGSPTEFVTTVTVPFRFVP